MKIGAIIGIQQPNVYSDLSKNRSHSKGNNKKKNNSNQKELSFNDIENLIKHSCFKRCRGGAIKQIK